MSWEVVGALSEDELDSPRLELGSTLDYCEWHHVKSWEPFRKSDPHESTPDTSSAGISMRAKKSGAEPSTSSTKSHSSRADAVGNLLGSAWVGVWAIPIHCMWGCLGFLITAKQPAVSI